MSRLRPGFRAKLALSIALVLLAALGVTYFAVYQGTGNELENRTETDLEREAERLDTQLRSGFAERPDEYLARARALVGAEGFGPNSRVITISIAGAGVATNQPGLIQPGLPDDSKDSGHKDEHEEDSEGGGGSGESSHQQQERRENAQEILGAEPGYSTIEIDDVGKVRLLTDPSLLPGGVAARIQVGQPLAPVDTALEGLSDTFLLVGLATLLLGALAGWLLASSATKPMRRMASVAEGVDGGDLSARMPVEGTRDEARRLAESFNGMLDRLEDAFDAQRTFVADASHDLRTPLTVVRGQIEVLARDPDPSAEEVRRVSALVSRSVDRMEAMVGDLLLLARAESDSGLGAEPSELGPLLEAEIESTIVEPGKDVRLGPVTERTVDINRDQFARVIANLVANAVVHASRTVLVGATDEGDEVTVTVEDDGPGVPEVQRRRIFDRFARLDESRSSASGGSGLGLAIVKAIAEAHGGRVACSASPLGGARFSVTLPASRGDEPV